MNKHLYSATLAHLRSRALKSIGLIEALLKDPPLDPRPGSDVVEKIAEQCLNLVQYEGAVHSLQSYFGHILHPPPTSHPAPQTPPAPPEDIREDPEEEVYEESDPPLEEPRVVTPDMSSTMRESLRLKFGDDGDEDEEEDTTGDWNDE